MIVIMSYHEYDYDIHIVFSEVDCTKSHCVCVAQQQQHWTSPMRVTQSNKSAAQQSRQQQLLKWESNFLLLRITVRRLDH